MAQVYRKSVNQVTNLAEFKNEAPRYLKEIYGRDAFDRFEFTEVEFDQGNGPEPHFQVIAYREGEDPVQYDERGRIMSDHNITDPAFSQNRIPSPDQLREQAEAQAARGPDYRDARGNPVDANGARLDGVKNTDGNLAYAPQPDVPVDQAGNVLDKNGNTIEQGEDLSQYGNTYDKNSGMVDPSTVGPQGTGEDQEHANGQVVYNKDLEVNPIDPVNIGVDNRAEFDANGNKIEDGLNPVDVNSDVNQRAEGDQPLQTQPIETDENGAPLGDKANGNIDQYGNAQPREENETVSAPANTSV